MIQFSQASLLPVLCAVVIASCERPPVEPEDSRTQIRLLTEPRIGTTLTSFRFTAGIAEGAGSSAVDTLGGYEVRWDWEDDGMYDTPWSTSRSADYQYATDGRHRLRASVRGGSLEGELSDTASVFIVIPKLLVPNDSTTPQLYPAWSSSASERIAFSWQRRLWCYQVWNDTLVDAGPNVDSLGFEACLYPDWSSNGRTLSFVNSAGLHTLNVVTQQVETLVPAAGGGSTAMQCWSPYGNRLLFLYQGIKILNPSDSTVEEFAVPEWNTASIRCFCWSPQGYYLAAGLSGGASGDVLEIRHVSTRDLVRSFAVPLSGDKIEWSPDGEWISLGFSDSSTFSLLSSVSGEIMKGRLDGFSGCGWPTWSRDAARLAFHAVGPGRGPLQEIWTMPFR